MFLLLLFVVVVCRMWREPSKGFRIPLRWSQNCQHNWVNNPRFWGKQKCECDVVVVVVVVVVVIVVGGAAV